MDQIQSDILISVWVLEAQISTRVDCFRIKIFPPLSSSSKFLSSSVSANSLGFFCCCFFCYLADGGSVVERSNASVLYHLLCQGSIVRTPVSASSFFC